MYLKIQFQDHICKGDTLSFSYCELYIKKIVKTHVQFRSLVSGDKDVQRSNFNYLSK